MIAVEFLYDYASPFSYLADCRIEEELRGLPVEIRRVPVYLRGFEAFQKGVPFTAAKLAYLGRDLRRWCDRHGIAFNGPASFPVNGLHLVRGATWLAGRAEFLAFHRAAWRATWVDARDVSSAEAAADVAASAGLDRAAFLAGIADDATKARVRAATDGAIARGAFGVPTFFVLAPQGAPDGDEMFWGNDRLEFVRRDVEKQLRGR